MEALDRFMEAIFTVLVSVTVLSYLILGVSLFIIVRDRIKFAKKEERNWFQISLITIMLVTLATAAFITVNAVSREVKEWGSQPCYGWPVPFMDNSTNFVGLLLAWDILAGIVIILTVLFVSESCIRSREAHRLNRVVKSPPPPPAAWR